MSGGAAVNAGIEYQQRVASWLLVLFYRRDDLAELFPGIPSFVAESVRFESDQPIDDIVLHAADGAVISFQVKRNVSLSDAVASEFGNAFRQFVKAHGKNPSAAPSRDLYVLATSGLSSRSVTTVLRGILEKIRANPAQFDAGLLTKAERVVFETVQRLVDSLNQELFKKSGEEILMGLLQRTHVTLLEVEPGTALEKAAFTLLLASQFKSPALIWGFLISTALTFAKNRISVGHPFLAATLEKYRSIDVTSPKPEDIDVLLGALLVKLDDLPSGKDVVICSHPSGDQSKVAIMELFRFDDDGTRRITYRDNQMVLLSGIKVTVCARFGSMASAERFIPKNLEFFADKHIDILAADPTAIAEVEFAPAVKAHRATLIQLLKTNAHFSDCLHCGQHVAKSRVYLVELDAPEYPAAVGLVHARCRRPADRILGEPLNNLDDPIHEIPGFDYAKWAKLLIRGQAGLRGIPRVIKAGLAPVIGWNDEVRYDAAFRYILRLETAGGDVSYCTRRGRIERFNKPAAEAGVIRLTELIKGAAQRGDPFAVNLDAPMFGPRSRVEAMREGDERLDLVTNVSMFEYSDVVGRIYNRADNFYTPCCILRDAETELPITICGALAFISRPLEIEKFTENWKQAGIDVGDYTLSIVENDLVFDQWMRDARRDGLAAFYDPWLDRDKRPGGVQIIPTSAMKAASQQTE